MAKAKFIVVDVCDDQGKIDWKKVKRSGIGGAIIRVSDSTGTPDKQCDRNIAQCEKYKIPYGLYIYSRAKDKKKVRKEANLILKKAKGHNIQFPLYIDLEQPGCEKYAKMAAKEFGRLVEKKGYRCGVYANQSWWKNYLVGLNRYSKWVARYGKKPTISGMDMWQYTMEGKISGILGSCDKNKCYIDFPERLD